VKRENLKMLVAALEDVLCERLPRTEAASE